MFPTVADLKDLNRPVRGDAGLPERYELTLAVRLSQLRQKLYAKRKRMAKTRGVDLDSWRAACLAFGRVADAVLVRSDRAFARSL